MTEKQKNNPIITGIFILAIGLLVGWLVSLGVKFGLKKYNEYWKSNNMSYWLDLNHFDTQSIDPDKMRTSDDKLRSDVLELLQSCMQDRISERNELAVKISEKYYKELCPNNLVDKKVSNWCGFSRFLILENKDKAIVAFDFSSVPVSMDKAEKVCLQSYKTRICNRLYLERIDGRWTVTDVYIVI